MCIHVLICMWSKGVFKDGVIINDGIITGPLYNMFINKTDLHKDVLIKKRNIKITQHYQ